jgi:Flp pilus assembly protein TadD
LAGRVFWFYLGKALLPLHLNLVYPQWKVHPAAFAAWVPDLLVCAVVLLCWRFRRACGRHVLFGLGVFAITLFPVLGFFDSQFLTRWRVSDHLQYLPLIAPVTLAAAALAVHLPSALFRCVAAALIAALSCLTFQRAHVFSSEQNLFRDTLAKNPAAWGIQSDYGVVLAARQDYAGAIQHFVASLQTNPDNPEAQSNLGEALAVQGKFKEAEPHFLVSLRLKPDDPETHRRFATALMQQDRTREALAHFAVALALSPKPDIRTRLDYANLLHQTGDLRQAALQLRQAVALEPDSVEALNNLAWLLATSSDATLRNGAEAVRLAERASRLPPVKEICVPGTLAAAYAEAGRFSDAVATAEKAVQEETAVGQTQFAAINQHLLSLYRAGRPFHEPPPPK